MRYYAEDLKYFHACVPVQYVDEVSQDAFENFIVSELDAGKKITSLNSRIRGLRVFFKFCAEREYTLFPEDASDVGLSWKSADEAVATVDASGVVTGIAPGQTTISISTEDGVIDTCSVTVKQKPAYERLSKKEKAFVDLAMKHLDAFKNPDSVIIKEIQEATLDNTWTVKVSAQNGFGGNTTTVYMLDDNFGFWNWGSFDIDVDLNITPDETYDIQLINDAIDELR